MPFFDIRYKASPTCKIGRTTFLLFHLVYIILQTRNVPKQNRLNIRNLRKQKVSASGHFAHFRTQKRKKRNFRKFKYWQTYTEELDGIRSGGRNRFLFAYPCFPLIVAGDFRDACCRDVPQVRPLCGYLQLPYKRTGARILTNFFSTCLSGATVRVEISVFYIRALGKHSCYC